MKRLVHRRIAAALIGRQAVLLEAGGGVIVLRLEHGVDAPAQIAGTGWPSRFQRRYHLDQVLAVAGEHAAE